MESFQLSSTAKCQMPGYGIYLKRPDVRLQVLTVPSKNRVNDKNGGALLLRILWWPAQEAAGRGDEATIAEWTQPGSGN